MVDTPLMKQYKEIKSQHQDSILFFRLGDFYEMFFEDAVKASKELGLTLTSRNKEKGQDIPLAGIPYHTASPYISKLISKGYKVAICEQTEDPKEAKGIVKREVIKIITPGTVMDVETLDSKSNNYLMSVRVVDNTIGVAYIDITTGEFKVSEIEGDNDYSKLISEFNKIEPKEHIHVNPITYYLKAEKSNRIHYKRNIVISVMMIIVTYMMCFQAYYQKETDTMINKAIDNELRISYKDGGNAYDMGGQPIPKTLIQDISNNSMVQSIQPFFQWNVLSMQETIVIQPYYGNMKTYKKLSY